MAWRLHFGSAGGAMIQGVRVDTAGRGRRRLIRVAGAATLCLVSGIGVAKMHSRLSGDESTLSAQEWRQLRAR